MKRESPILPQSLEWLAPLRETTINYKREDNTSQTNKKTGVEIVSAFNTTPSADDVVTGINISEWIPSDSHTKNETDGPSENSGLYIKFWEPALPHSSSQNCLISLNSIQEKTNLEYDTSAYIEHNIVDSKISSKPYINHNERNEIIPLTCVSGKKNSFISSQSYTSSSLLTADSSSSSTGTSFSKPESDSNPGTILPTPSKTIEAGRATLSPYQIVLCRDRRIVVYNPENRHVGARALSPSEEAAIRIYRMSYCPMCGQAIDPSNFSFEAQSYFKILQEILRARWESAARRRSSMPGTTHDMNFLRQGTNEYMFEAPPSLRRHGWRYLLSNIDDEDHWKKQKTGGSTIESRFGKYDQSTPYNPFVHDVEMPTIDSSSECRYSKKNECNNTTTSHRDYIPSPKNLSTGMFITGYYSNFFQEIRRLGSGSYGQVYLCHHLLDDVYLGEYAVKKVPVGDDKSWLQKMLREVKIRERLHNANIVEYKHSWLEMHSTSPHLPIIPWLFVLMEFCNGGDLDCFLTRQKYLLSPHDPIQRREKLTVMKETHIWKLFFDIANGLNHLHHSGILHRDLKPQNILLQCTLDTVSGRPTTSALLSDFGTAELLSDQGIHHDRQGFTGTVEYTAPEMLETDDLGQFCEDYDEKSDIWSLGMVLFVMAYGFIPYFHDDPKNCRIKILTHQDPRQLIPDSPDRSPDLVLLIEALLQRDPYSRPSLDTILYHPRIRERLADSSELEVAGLEMAYLLSSYRRMATPAAPPNQGCVGGSPTAVSNADPLPLLLPSASMCNSSSPNNSH